MKICKMKVALGLKSFKCPFRVPAKSRQYMLHSRFFMSDVGKQARREALDTTVFDDQNRGHRTMFWHVRGTLVEKVVS